MDYSRAWERLGKWHVSYLEHMLRKHNLVGIEETREALAHYTALLNMYRQARNNGTPFLVYSENAQSGYDSVHHGWCFRAVHDLLHIELQRNFSAEHEMQVAMHHLRLAWQEFGAGSQEGRILAGETIGQTLYYMLYGNYVDEQRRFDELFAWVLDKEKYD